MTLTVSTYVHMQLINISIMSIIHSTLFSRFFIHHLRTNITFSKKVERIAGLFCKYESVPNNKEIFDRTNKYIRCQISLPSKKKSVSAQPSCIIDAIYPFLLFFILCVCFCTIDFGQRSWDSRLTNILETWHICLLVWFLAQKTIALPSRAANLGSHFLFN